MRAVFVFVLLVLLARVVYLVWFCGYDLVEDEAHYWLWSRFPAWSYYTKGPGVAWAIWLSTKIFGDAEWVVRLPTAIAGAIGALAAGALARDVAADAIDRGSGEQLGGKEWASPARVGLLGALAYTLVPAVQGASILMTIDGPYVACWSVACWAFWRAIRSRTKIVGPSRAAPRWRGMEGWEWAVVGAAIGIGFLFKYTILLLIPGLLAYAFIARKRTASSSPEQCGASRNEPRANRIWFSLGIFLALAGLAPVLIWNAQNGWPTIAHLLGHLGMAGGDMPISTASDGGSKWSPWWLAELIGEQVGMVGPWLVLAALALRGPRRAGQTFLLCAAAPILIFYAIVALIAEPEGNWPMGAYATLMPLAAWLAADALATRRAAIARREPTPRSARTAIVLWRAGLGYAALAAILIHTMDLLGDAALSLARQKWFHDAFVSVVHREPRDPAGRVRGAKEMAVHVRELLEHLRQETDREPFVIAQHYGRASQLAYYLRAPEEGVKSPAILHSTKRGEALMSRRWVGPYEVLCAMYQTGGRRSQFDIWAQASLKRPELLGRPAVIVTSVQQHMLDQWRTMFERVEPIPGERLRGEGKVDRSAFLGYGWKGVPGDALQPPVTP